ncbi:hypothetical protein AVEN_192638-1 [Araneus ventricosus]|uniref:Uncharacterized protein n=1 Tax=Araneus ventricosus TaxID=182803 RepID=A0A4Y2RF04_ARAVE|nr:hypothetical protein AVEN_3372-1 [Araneus ventricosus]GBN77724.1 hypothetical protein AVEN_192638-1 [Araneus ventricosus]
MPWRDMREFESSSWQEHCNNLVQHPAALELPPLEEEYEDVSQTTIIINPLRGNRHNKVYIGLPYVRISSRLPECRDLQNVRIYTSGRGDREIWFSLRKSDVFEKAGANLPVKGNSLFTVLTSIVDEKVVRYNKAWRGRGTKASPEVTILDWRPGLDHRVLKEALIGNVAYVMGTGQRRVTKRGFDGRGATFAFVGRELTREK